MSLPTIPLSPEAQRLFDQIMPRIKEGLAEVDRVPVAVLLWGPGMDSTSPLREVRLHLRAKLREAGHAAFLSEELYDPGLPYPLRVQQINQAKNFDLVVSIPCTPGSIAEVHDFAVDRRVTSKLLVFLNEEHLGGYSPQSLQVLSSIISCQIEYYPNEHETDVIEVIAFDHVVRIRDLKYISMGRY